MLVKAGTELLSVEDGILDMTLDEMIRVGDVKTEALPDAEDARAYFAGRNMA